MAQLKEGDPRLRQIARQIAQELARLLCPWCVTGCYWIYVGIQTTKLRWQWQNGIYDDLLGYVIIGLKIENLQEIIVLRTKYAGFQHF